MISTLAKYASGFGIVNRRQERAAAAALANQFQVNAPSIESDVNILSGGNQQKALIARLFNARLSMYLVDNPTFGVDVRSKAQVHGLLCEELDRGAGILLHSSDLEELVQLSDRILLFKKGRVDRELVRGEVDANELEGLLEA
jgi:ABC-type sugar transport system ATPase subunit